MGNMGGFSHADLFTGSYRIPNLVGFSDGQRGDFLMQKSDITDSKVVDGLSPRAGAVGVIKQAIKFNAS